MAFTPSSNGLAAPAAPAALTLKAGSTTIIVTVPATATVVRGSGGPSSLDEFAPRDRIVAKGVFQTNTTFLARRITDVSVQAHGRVDGTIVTPPQQGSTQQGSAYSLTLRRGNQHNSRSQLVTVNLTSSTPIVSGTITVTVGALQTGTHVLALGTYNRTQSTLRASRVRVLNARRHA
jgi:hypothetical protein